MREMVKIGNAAGFWGDRPNAAFRLLEQEPSLDFLTLDYLAEMSLSIMAIQREKDPNLGYAKDFLDVVLSLIPLWKAGSRCKVITNAGGLNPLKCAANCATLIKQAGLSLNIAVVFGDDVLPIVQKNPENKEFNHLDTKKKVTTVIDNLVSANAYFGAKPIVDALSKGADLVITGRVADPSLCVAAAYYHFNWKDTDYDKIAGATIAGHLIECGSQVTGGFLTDWQTVPKHENIGFPFVELFEDGSFVITKPISTGGVVNEKTVKEQLLYEILDPNAYLSPDATVSFLGLKLQKKGKNRIYINGAKGFAPPKTYKVSAAYRDGFKAEGMLAIFGEDAIKKAKMAGKMILERVKAENFSLEKTEIECIGAKKECVLRVAVADKNYKAVEFFTKEIAPLITSGPQGITGYATARPAIRELFSYWPCLIDMKKVKPKIRLI